jgi:mannose-6-phosphate isomerase
VGVIPPPSNRPADRFYRSGRKITEFRRAARPRPLAIGLGGIYHDLALQAAECRRRSNEEISQLVRAAGFGSSVLPDAADAYFRLERVALNGEATLDPGFAVLVLLKGEIDLEGESPVHLRRGNTAVAPNAFGPLKLQGRGELLACRPPRPR